MSKTLKVIVVAFVAVSAILYRADIASAALDRAIKITKISTPEQMPAAGGQVVYQYNVTNPGLLALQEITVTDDKCSPINYANGDVNNNKKLEPGETWKYICNAQLAATTTSIAAAKGQANGTYVTDTASLTVLVGSGEVVPKALPKTGGGGAAANGFSWYWFFASIVVIGIAASNKKILKSLYLAR